MYTKIFIAALFIMTKQKQSNKKTLELTSKRNVAKYGMAI